jgi:hypothetical protein
MREQEGGEIEFFDCAITSSARRWMTNSNLLDCRLCTLKDATVIGAGLTRADIHDGPEHERTLM